MQFSQYIRESCEIQNATTPDDYIGMSLAFNYALALWSNKSKTPFHPDMTPVPIIKVGHCQHLIQFVRSTNGTEVGFRSQPATFTNGRIVDGGIERIERNLNFLLDAQNVFSPEEFYWAFEDIHPWTDGNGRVGSLLFNMLNNSIIDPIHPPDNPAWKK